jgi:ubiquinone/menaquinone biosynthesis C-methylase UbiE/uncharacterized protein YbaR (Trm112 family)
MQTLDPFLFSLLVCPRDKSELQLGETGLVCEHGHTYPVVDGVPVMLLEEADATLAVCGKSMQLVKEGHLPGPLDYARGSAEIDSFVQKEIVGTNGNMYQGLVNALPRYPIPEMRLPPASGALLLDIGCGWGRWCIAAARKGYMPIGIDPSLEAVLAARRVSAQVGGKAYFLVADARFLPFRRGVFEVVFSYSVLQHFSKENVAKVLEQVATVLKPAGICYVQMATTYGLRNLLIQLRRGFRQPKSFEVRYWTPTEIRQVFGSFIGTASLSVDGFFSLNVQPTDVDLLPGKYRLIVACSEWLRRTSERVRWLTYLADSLYVRATRQAPDKAAMA